MKASIDWFQRFRSGERRKAERIADPRLLAYYWDGDNPKAHTVRDISATGLYLLTEAHWYPRTLVRLTLQVAMGSVGTPESSITVETMVVRQDRTGVGFMFLPQGERSAGMSDARLANGADRKMLENFLKHIRTDEHSPGKLSTLITSR
jgi:PilZ domain